MLYSNNVVPLHVPITTVMPRQTRRKSGTGIYHVMLRGINRQDISDEEIRTILRFDFNICCGSDFQRLDKKQRNNIIKSLCERGAGTRHLSRITGISYGIIQRVK